MMADLKGYMWNRDLSIADLVKSTLTLIFINFRKMKEMKSKDKKHSQNKRPQQAIYGGKAILGIL